MSKFSPLILNMKFKYSVNFGQVTNKKNFMDQALGLPPYQGNVFIKTFTINFNFDDHEDKLLNGTHTYNCQVTDPTNAILHKIILILFDFWNEFAKDVADRLHCCQTNSSTYEYSSNSGPIR